MMLALPPAPTCCLACRLAVGPHQAAPPLHLGRARGQPQPAGHLWVYLGGGSCRRRCTACHLGARGGAGRQRRGGQPHQQPAAGAAGRAECVPAEGSHHRPPRAGARQQQRAGRGAPAPPAVQPQPGFGGQREWLGTHLLATWLLNCPRTKLRCWPEPRPAARSQHGPRHGRRDGRSGCRLPQAAATGLALRRRRLHSSPPTLCSQPMPCLFPPACRCGRPPPRTARSALCM